MGRQQETWTYIERGDNSRLVTVETEVTLASGMNIEDVKYIIELHNRERNFQSKLKPPIKSALPFVVETLQRAGSMPRYRVSRHRGGGVYSDEFLDIKEAEFMRHTLEREEDGKEQLRYRIWQLEQALNAAKEAMIATRLHITHHPTCAADDDINKDCDCRRAVLNTAIKKLEEL